MSKRKIELTKEEWFSILGIDDPFPTTQLLIELAEVTESFLERTGYDGHGHEVISESVKKARERAETIKKIVIKKAFH